MKRPTFFDKQFASTAALRKALVNHQLCNFLLPELVADVVGVDWARRSLRIAWIDGSNVRTALDLCTAASSLGLLHSRWTKYRKTSDIICVTPFASNERVTAYGRGYEMLKDPLKSPTPRNFFATLKKMELRASSLYKDGNVTNFVVNSSATHIIDCTTVTCAPFGYDFAKLLLTYFLRFWPVNPVLIRDALSSYEVSAGSSPSRGAFFSNLMFFLDIHWVMTLPFCGKNNYLVPWPSIRRSLVRQRALPARSTADVRAPILTDYDD